MKERNPQQQIKDNERRNDYPDSHSSRGGAGNLWLGMIIGGLLVLVAVLAYQLFTTRQQLGTVSNNPQAVPPATTLPSAVPPQATTQAPASTNSSAETNDPQSSVTASAPSPTAQVPTSNGIQPGQFVKPVATRTGEVELVSVKRVQNPKSGKRDLVMIKMNVRRLDYSNDSNKTWTFATYNTTVNNPETYDQYTVVDGTGPVFLGRIAQGTTAGAYMKVKIPEDVNLVDIFIKNVEVFKNVPIEN